MFITSVRLFCLLILLVTPAFSQSKNRIVQWPERPFDDRNTTSEQFQVLKQIEALVITDVAVAGKSITLGQPFAADDQWLKNLTVRVKNVSSETITSVQISVFLPEIMPGGPLVPVCYGCGGIGMGLSIKPGEEVEMGVGLYKWVEEVINKMSNLSNITKAEIHSIMVRMLDKKPVYSGCMKAANEKNKCPVTEP